MNVTEMRRTNESIEQMRTTLRMRAPTAAMRAAMWHPLYARRASECSLFAPLLLFHSAVLRRPPLRHARRWADERRRQKKRCWQQRRRARPARVRYCSRARLPRLLARFVSTLPANCALARQSPVCLAQQQQKWRQRREGSEEAQWQGEGRRQLERTPAGTMDLSITHSPLSLHFPPSLPERPGTARLAQASLVEKSP
jgi:hypothetical protein